MAALRRRGGKRTAQGDLLKDRKHRTSLCCLEQLLDASFHPSFLAVAFIGAFAVPLIERTSGPRAAALNDLGDPDRDLHLAAGVAQFRIEMRLLAETMQLWTRWPEKICAFAVTYPMRAGLYFYELILTSAMIQIGLALPMAMYFHRVSFSGLSAKSSPPVSFASVSISR